MGFFSFKTTDTNKSISNIYAVEFGKIPFPIALVDDKQNIYIELNYEGYGIFGNKNIFDLFAEMNNIIDNTEIDKFYSGNKKLFKYPMLIANFNPFNIAEKAKKYKNKKIKNCEFQGYFYNGIQIY